METGMFAETFENLHSSTRLIPEIGSCVLKSGRWYVKTRKEMDGKALVITQNYRNK
jgi:hypothetical protein